MLAILAEGLGRNLEIWIRLATTKAVVWLVGFQNYWQLLFNVSSLCLSLAGKNVRVVTDHGWLLMPKGLPKSELPSS